VQLVQFATQKSPDFKREIDRWSEFRVFPPDLFGQILGQDGFSTNLMGKDTNKPRRAIQVNAELEF